MSLHGRAYTEDSKLVHEVHPRCLPPQCAVVETQPDACFEVLIYRVSFPPVPGVTAG